MLYSSLTISLACSVALLIFLKYSRSPSIVSTLSAAALVPCVISSSTCLVVSVSHFSIFCIFPADFALSSDNARISSATTAKPFPCSPALAASIDALSDNRLVCAAIELISPRMSVIFFICVRSSLVVLCAAPTVLLTEAIVLLASSTASLPFSTASLTLLKPLSSCPASS